MNPHPNAVLLTKVYEEFAKGNFNGMLNQLGDSFTFQVAGKSPLAGKYSHSNFVSGFVEKLSSLSNGTFKFEVHDVLASDLHGTVLGTISLSAHGKAAELRTVHVWRFESGKPIAGYEYSRDLYQFDLAWN